MINAKILIVDDEATIRRLLTRHLEEAGHICCCAENVESAKTILASDSFDLLLCDLKMPGESGLTLIKFAKDHYPDIGRVMITGFGTPEIASEIMEVGVYGYIIKPISRNVVLITVENALRHLRLDLQMLYSKNDLEKKISSRTEKLTAIMNGLGVGVVMVDPDMKILEMNRQMLEFFPKFTLGATLRCFQTFDRPEDKDVCDDCPTKKTLETGKTCEIVKKFEVEQEKRDFRIVTSPIRDKSDKVYASIALYEDITERMALERDLHQAQKLESVGQLAAGIAHEINSPIQYVGDNLSFLRDSFNDIENLLQNYQTVWKELAKDGVISKEASQKLTQAEEEADIEYLQEELPKTFEQSLEGVHRVDKIVRAMKDFSHPGNDEKTPVNINKIIESTTTVCRNEWKYVAEMSLDLDPELPMTPCFAGEISQVLLNIIVNGAHAIADVTDGGSKGLGKIAISTRSTVNGIKIRIGDTGGGIPDAIRERVFDPFFTTKARGQGTGQGLAIAHRVIVENHRGALSFASEMGKGTTFSIELPNSD